MWTIDELAKINAADELHLATLRKDGTYRNPVTIWVIRIDNALYVRAVKGLSGKWFRHALENHHGHIEAGGISKDVTFMEVEDESKATIDKTYQNKYSRYGATIVDSTLTPQAQAATLKIIPR